jgi:hypothetical protein
MSGRRLAQIGLLAIVAVTLVMVFRPQRDERSSSASAVQNESHTGVTYVAYYFHGNIRCDTCRSIEAQAEAAVRDGFSDELANGTLEWQAVNTDQPENAHFTEDFSLTHSTLVLVEREGNETRRFTSFDRVWELVFDEDDQFRRYVQDGIAQWVRTGT